MTRYLTTEQALRIARHATGGPVEVRDVGLLDAAVHRPRASVLGHDAYPDLPRRPQRSCTRSPATTRWSTATSASPGWRRTSSSQRTTSCWTRRTTTRTRSWSPSPRVTSTTSHRSLASWPAGSREVAATFRRRGSVRRSSQRRVLTTGGDDEPLSSQDGEVIDRERPRLRVDQGKAGRMDPLLLSYVLSRAWCRGYGQPAPRIDTGLFVFGNAPVPGSPTWML